MEASSTHNTTTSAALNQDEGPSGGPLKCPECDSTFAKANKLKRHLQNVHQDVVSIFPYQPIRDLSGAKNVARTTSVEST